MIIMARFKGNEADFGKVIAFKEGTRCFRVGTLCETYQEGSIKGNQYNDDGSVELLDRKSTRLNSSHSSVSRMPSSA